MRSEFQDVFKDAYDHWIDDACSHRYNASKGLALQVWQHQQSKVDELQCEVKRLNLWYSNVKLQLENKEIDSAIDAKKIDELQKQLIDQGQRFNEQSQRIKDLEHKNDELQKRVDTSLIAYENLKEEINQLHGQCDLHLIKYLEEKSQVLEQAIKGGIK